MRSAGRSRSTSCRSGAATATPGGARSNARDAPSSSRRAATAASRYLTGSIMARAGPTSTTRRVAGGGCSRTRIATWRSRRDPERPPLRGPAALVGADPPAARRAGAVAAVSRRAWKQRERDVARATGGRRSPANTGGRVDVENDTFVIQVKERQRLSLAALEALAL